MKNKKCTFLSKGLKVTVLGRRKRTRARCGHCCKKPEAEERERDMKNWKIECFDYAEVNEELKKETK